MLSPMTSTAVPAGSGASRLPPHAAIATSAARIAIAAIPLRNAVSCNIDRMGYGILPRSAFPTIARSSMHRRRFVVCLAGVGAMLATPARHALAADPPLVAAASDLRFALDEIAAA